MALPTVAAAFVLLIAGHKNQLMTSVGGLCLGVALLTMGPSTLRSVLTRQVRRRPIAAQLQTVLIGVALGGGLFAIGIAALVALHATSVTWSRAALITVVASLLYWTAASAAIAIVEEALCRSYILDSVAEHSSIATGVVVSSVVFGLLHLPNAGASYAAVTFLMVHGLFFAACRLLTGDLTLAIGAHMGWNLAEGGVSGARISGLHALGVWRTVAHRGSLLNGGAFGPEAGIITVVFVAAAATVVFALGSRPRHRAS
ncbi:MAG: protease family protein [Actinomycetota bacterium]